MEKKYIASVDFGNSNMVLAAGSLDNEGLVHIETVVSMPSKGIENGLIENINEVSNTLNRLREKAEEQTGARISEVYAGLSGSFIRYENYVDHVFVSEESNGIVTKADVEALHERMRRVTVPEGEVIMDCFPQNYSVDGRPEDANPVGTFGRQLSSRFAFIVSEKKPLDRLKMVFGKTNMHPAGIFANSAVTAQAILKPQEMYEGVAMVDIGGATTNIAVYKGGLLRYAASIPLGAKAIDSDINKHGVPEYLAEKIKIRGGSAVADKVQDNSRLEISGRTTTVVMKHNLAAIVEARLTDIAEYVKGEIRESGCENKLPCGLVLTGGAAATRDIEELFRRLTNMCVRTATASEGITRESAERIDTPEYTAAVALLLEAAKSCPLPQTTQAEEEHESSNKPKADEEKPFTNTSDGDKEQEQEKHGTHDDGKAEEKKKSVTVEKGTDNAAEDEDEDENHDGSEKKKSWKWFMGKVGKVGKSVGRSVDALSSFLEQGGVSDDPSFSDMDAQTDGKNGARREKRSDNDRGNDDFYFIDGKDKDEI